MGNILPTLGTWDIILLIAVTLVATVVAYVHDPRHKAFLITLPIPFTVASLALGKPIGVCSVAGLFVLLTYTHGVCLLHYRVRLPIVPAIVISAVGYCLMGWVLTKVLPEKEWAFWSILACAFLVAIGCLRLLPIPNEPGHRTPLPIWIKLPIIAAVVLFVIALKQVLQGFMPLFPMLALVGGYEARHSLRTIRRQITVIMLALGSFMAVAHLTQDKLGLGYALLLGWVAFILSFIAVRCLIAGPKRPSLSP